MSLAGAPERASRHGQSTGGGGRAGMLWVGGEIYIFIPQGGVQGGNQASYGLGSTPIGWGVKRRSRKHMGSPSYLLGSATYRG